MADELTELDAAALDFARDCLGWPEVEVFAVDYKKRVVRNLAVTGGCWTVFYASDLNTVMEKVQEWCDANEASIEIGYSGPAPGEWDAHAITPVSVVSSTNPDLRVAVMVACAAAARKLKGSGA